MTDVGVALAAATARLRSAEIDEPRRDAQVLLGHALGLGREAILGYPERVLSSDEEVAFALLLDRRSRREPISHIIGRREFWSLSFRVTAAVLDPRPDSETLVAAALGHVLDRSAPLRLLDLGTGSGCLLLALLHELPVATGLGIDVSPEAVAVAEENAERLGLAPRATFLAADWTAGVAGPFDIVVANPPYIPEPDMALLAPEITLYEPRLALVGGRDGLDAYRALAPQLRSVSRPHGIAAMEIGQGQDAAVGAIFSAAGWVQIGTRKDLGGVNRSLVFQMA
jgi:release factor glutamine methyltransferase